MKPILYDLCGANPEQRFSPYCWRTVYALAHKGIEVEVRPTPFTKIKDIAPEAGKTVPILVDGDKTICDSTAIAAYLEDAYPDRPSLFGGEGGRAASHFFESYVISMMPIFASLVVKDVHDVLAPDDQAYFRTTREQRFGKSLEEVQAGRENRLGDLAKALKPLELMLASQPFVGGESPLYGDYVIFAALQWGRVVSDIDLLEAGTPVHAWFERLLDMYDGLGRKVATGQAAAAA
ncbi:glutathione S-transferase family protein [Stappia sp. GBMRC 2046]|uniref:Glutathione S-transferase family protein n=1 Tax=Stappia sediminis TaxID=2692190 RepID=A0A7X3S774_9HYPH|nr:glutathione S-transferase N-terminal domain-containing protein [Stappia sediminis]MXN64487.1 glutathione S-transferase family protein [Stappia sediminis]